MTSNSKVKRVKLREGEGLQISIPEGKLAVFKWNGRQDYNVLLVDT